MGSPLSLVAELERLSLPFAENELPSESELRVAQAQLVGWLEGLFHGIQTTLFAQQMAARAQLEQMRRALPPGMMPGHRGRPAHSTAGSTGPTCDDARVNGLAAGAAQTVTARPLDAAVTQPGQPRGGVGEVGVGRAGAHLRGAAVATRVAAEEPYVRADPAQPHQRLADPRFVDVALAVDREAVPAEHVAGGPGLHAGQVDAAHGELGQDLRQRAWMVVGEKRGQ